MRHRSRANMPFSPPFTPRFPRFAPRFSVVAALLTFIYCLPGTAEAVKPETQQKPEKPEKPEKPLPTDFQLDLFVAGEGGYQAYRIPSLITTANGTVLAFCEARKTGLSDDGDIDLLCRRSEDGGRTWLPPALVIEEGGAARIKFGNPTAVVDGQTGAIWLAVNRDYLDEQGRRGGGALVLLRSDDEGKTWSEPIDITRQVKHPDWRHHAFGPGVGIQLQRGPQAGRLILPANFRTSFDKREPSWSHVIYSDDHGKSWQAGGKLGKYTNECQIVETLEDGQPGLLFNARNHWGRGGVAEKSGRRIVARSVDGGATWSPDQTDPALSDPPCQASLLRFAWPADGAPGSILFANPAGAGRQGMTVRLSVDEGRTWPHERLLYPGAAAYSCLTRLPDGRVGLVFERDNYRRLTFTAFTLEWLRGP